MDNLDFEDIRPYNDAEVAQAMKRIAASPTLKQATDFLFPGEDCEQFRNMIASITSSWEFQVEVMQPSVRSIVAQTSAGVSCEGFDKMIPGLPYLIVSNHRDIVLDSAILQVLLYDNNLSTSEISFGDNLMSGPFVVDIGKSNKMFKVLRNANPKEFYHNSLVLSSYIRQAITQDRQSVWIAQRNGRTKNGLDLTEQGILKMFAMSANPERSFSENFAELNLAPITVSYEYEPCDREKTLENFVSLSGKYVKKPGEDLQSILKGIRQYKGRIHYSVANPITIHELQEIEGHYDKNERFKALASLIDTRIQKGFRKWKTNYMAFDLLEGHKEYSSYSPNAGKYTEDELNAFKAYMDARIGDLPGDPSSLRRIFLSIYAGPLKV